MKRIAWQCKIGSPDGVEVPPGGDAPMRAAVEKAFKDLTGEEAKANFSGWGEEFTPQELAVIRNDGCWSEVPWVGELIEVLGELRGSLAQTYSQSPEGREYLTRIDKVLCKWSK